MERDSCGTTHRYRADSPSTRANVDVLLQAITAVSLAKYSVWLCKFCRTCGGASLSYAARNFQRFLPAHSRATRVEIPPKMDICSSGAQRSSRHCLSGYREAPSALDRAVRFSCNCNGRYPTRGIQAVQIYGGTGTKVAGCPRRRIYARGLGPLNCHPDRSGRFFLSLVPTSVGRVVEGPLFAFLGIVDSFILSSKSFLATDSSSCGFVRVLAKSA